MSKKIRNNNINMNNNNNNNNNNSDNPWTSRRSDEGKKCYNLVGLFIMYAQTYLLAGYKSHNVEVRTFSPASLAISKNPPKFYRPFCAQRFYSTFPK